jgi:hypothetical protein
MSAFLLAVYVWIKAASYHIGGHVIGALLIALALLGWKLMSQASPLEPRRECYPIIQEARHENAERLSSFYSHRRGRVCAKAARPGALVCGAASDPASLTAACSSGPHTDWPSRAR